MIIWFAMLIPLIGCIVAYKIWPKKFVWWEFIVPTAASAVFILIMKFTVESSMLRDTEYMGGLIVEARYYESWTSWVTQECSYTTTCCCDSKGENCRTETHYYDCSYCDNNSAYWKVYDDQGHSWRISKSEYNRLKTQWNATPEFVELNRDIRYHGGCGQDGDMYKIRWDGGILSSEPSTWASSYENHVQASKSNFALRDISKSEAKKYGLYNYPIVIGYHQTSILGLDTLTFLSQSYKNGANKMFDYFNGMYGPKRKIRVFVLLFYDKPFDVAIKQKNYWDGGNKNEIVICIDVNKTTGRINWVYPFSWSENKRISIDLREDIMNMGILNFTNLYHIVDTSTVDFIYRDFSQFDYLSVDTPTWEIWLVYLITLGITIWAFWYGYRNEFEEN